MKKWIMSVALSVIGILGLCLIPAKNVNAGSSDTIQIGKAELSKTTPYLLHSLKHDEQFLAIKLIAH